MSKARWKKKPERAAKAKARSVHWGSAKPARAREANTKLREARLHRAAAEGETPLIVARPVPRRRIRSQPETSEQHP